jgi:hypothetical protein
MNLRLFVRARIAQVRWHWAKQRVLRRGPAQEPAIARTDWPQSLADPTGFYLRCFRYFHRRLPEDVQAHRRYFTQARRGFGEEAFHALWFLLDRELQPVHFLEIGVYRGQVLSLLALLQKRAGRAGTVAGISPFSPAGDSVSRYRRDVDYYEDTLAHFRHFALPPPTLCRAYSTDPGALELIASRPWDCIYIDGNHDYDVAKADWENCSAQVKPGGVIVLDDAGLTTNYAPPIFATQGHPGPSKVAAEIDRTKFEEILQVGHNRVFQRMASA